MVTKYIGDFGPFFLLTITNRAHENKDFITVRNSTTYQYGNNIFSTFCNFRGSFGDLDSRYVQNNSKQLKTRPSSPRKGSSSPSHPKTNLSITPFSHRIAHKP